MYVWVRGLKSLTNSTHAPTTSLLTVHWIRIASIQFELKWYIYATPKIYHSSWKFQICYCVEIPHQFLGILANTDAKMTLPQTSVFLWLLLCQFCKRCDASLTHVTYRCRSNKKIRKIAAQLTLGNFLFLFVFCGVRTFVKSRRSFSSSFQQF